MRALQASGEYKGEDDENSRGEHKRAVDRCSIRFEGVINLAHSALEDVLDHDELTGVLDHDLCSTKGGLCITLGALCDGWQACLTMTCAPHILLSKLVWFITCLVVGRLRRLATA